MLTKKPRKMLKTSISLRCSEKKNLIMKRHLSQVALLGIMDTVSQNLEVVKANKQMKKNQRFKFEIQLKRINNLNLETITTEAEFSQSQTTNKKKTSIKTLVNRVSQVSH